jgi:mannose-1-phosphate guanylyltransferase / mannose-6-phosphate isomerase
MALACAPCPSLRESAPLIPVVLSGGAGTRLWPLSRESLPKQLHALESGKGSLLQETLRRLDGLQGVRSEAPIVVCNQAYRFITAEQLRALGIHNARILLEPEGRNTAPALTLAALAALEGQNENPRFDPVLLVMPADHLIEDAEAFHRAILTAYPAACAGQMLTFGVVPTRPETGYGYLLRETTLACGGVYPLRRFVEKPDAHKARAYLESGDYLWNSGLFMMKARLWLETLARLEPEIHMACMMAFQKAIKDMDFVRIDPPSFLQSPQNSIDYAVMERICDASQDVMAATVPLVAGWSDVGAWDAVWEALPKDAHGNVQQGDVLLENCQNSLFVSQSRLVAAIGLEGMVVIDTPDALLVAPQSQSQNVKNTVAHLKAKSHPLATTHRKVYRPWGWYDTVDIGPRFQVKRICVHPGARLSLQRHHHRAEHWIVVRGTAEVTHEDRVFLLSENESTFIPLGHVHRLANPGKLPLEIIEVQSGSYLGEDDIVRFDDTYGRTV